MLLGISVVKNESDIIEAMVRLNLRFLDHLHIVDNASSDGTFEILGKLAQELPSLSVESDRRSGHLQTEIMNSFVENYADSFKPMHIFPLDADEIISGDRDAIRTECRSIQCPILIPWQTYVPTANDNYLAENPIVRIRFRRVIESPQYFKTTLPGGMIGLGWFTQGSHEINLGPKGDTLKLAPSVISETISLAHFPVRTVDQITAKALIGSWGLELRHASPGEGYQWRQIKQRIIESGHITNEAFLQIAETYAALKPLGIVEAPQWWGNDWELKYSDLASASAQSGVIAFTNELVASLASSEETRLDTDTDKLDRVLEVDTLPRGSRLIRSRHRGRPVEYCVTHPHDEIQKHHLEGKFYEAEELNIIEAHFEKGSVFVDIGANVGNHSVFCGLFLNPDKIIVAEPNPAIIPTLKSNIQLNGLDGLCDLSRVGVGVGAKNADGASIVWRYKGWDKANVGGAQLSIGGGNLTIMRGDDFLADDTADFIKIDIEGMEIMALNGLSETINRDRPKLFVEVDQQNYAAMSKWITQNRYRVVARFSRYPSNCNYMCVPE